MWVCEKLRCYLNKIVWVAKPDDKFGVILKYFNEGARER